MKTNKPLPKVAQAVIIGGGISGLSIAWHLAKKGMKDIVVLEKAYLGSGATGRCGAGIRQQWSTEANCLMAKKSVEFFEKAQDTLAYEGDIEFKQEGYLIVASDQEEADAFKKNVALQNRLDIPSRILSKAEARKIVPHLNQGVMHSASFCPSDGHLNPFTTLDAFYHAAMREGVEVFTFTEARAIEKDGNTIKAVVTDKGRIETPIVINAAGGYAQAIGAMAGVDIPVYSQNREILVTEPIERMQGPMVISFSKNIYCQQTPHGAFIMGRGDDREAGYSVTSTHTFLDEMAKTVTELLPPIGELRVIRQWGGLYNMSPDHQPIISDSPVEGFFIACGFSGHGFMLAPMTGLLLSEIVMGETPTLPVENLSLARFEGKTNQDVEKNVV
ncbi:MAG: NAD(P)/FAD-dependent oxidoreductase [Bacillota bacterium]